MWRLKREDIPGVPDAVRISAELLAAAPVGPAPLTDAAVIEQLQKQLAAKNRTIGHLQDEIRALTDRTPDGDCPGCAGLRKVVADLENGRAEDRRLIARLRLADPAERARTWTAPPAEVT